MNKKMKENPMFKNSNKKVRGLGGGATEEENEVKRFIIIVIIIGLFVGVIYGLTEIFKKDEEKKEEEKQEITISYDKLTVGTLLNRPYDEYYVLAYDGDANKAVEYSAILSQYKSKSSEKDYVKIYFLDLSNGLNKKYYNVNEDNKSNPNAKKIEGLDFGDLTLLYINDGKIKEYIEDYKTIQKKLS